MCLSLQAALFKEFSRIVFMCFTVQLSRFSFVFCLATAHLIYHSCNRLSTTFFNFFYFLKSRFCCYSVAFCDSSYRIPLILRIVNMFFTFFLFVKCNTNFQFLCAIPEIIFSLSYHQMRNSLPVFLHHARSYLFIIVSSNTKLVSSFSIIPKIIAHRFLFSGKKNPLKNTVAYTALFFRSFYHCLYYYMYSLFPIPASSGRWSALSFVSRQTG